MIRRCALVVGWMAVVSIAFSTLSPIGLRPKTGYPDEERFLAFFMGGACLAIGYPRYRCRVSLGVVIGGSFLEAAQLFIPGRDAHVHHAVVKIIGGLAGLTFAAIAEHLASHQQRV